MISILLSTSTTCDTVKERYLNEACCGDSGTKAVCVAPSISTSSLGYMDCFSQTSLTGSIPTGCDALFPGSTRTALSAGQVGQNDNAYSSFAKKSFSLVKETSLFAGDMNMAGGGKLQNFWHSMTLTPTHVYLGVRHTPSFVPSEAFNYPSLSGVYKYNRATLALEGKFSSTPTKPAVMRYAPVGQTATFLHRTGDIFRRRRALCTRLTTRTCRPIRRVM